MDGSSLHGELAQGDRIAAAYRIVAPVQPGGGVDLVARTIAERLTKSMG